MIFRYINETDENFLSYRIYQTKDACGVIDSIAEARFFSTQAGKVLILRHNSVRIVVHPLSSNELLHLQYEIQAGTPFDEEAPDPLEARVNSLEGTLTDVVNIINKQGNNMTEIARRIGVEI